MHMMKSKIRIDASTPLLIPIINPKLQVVGVAVGVNKFVAVGVSVAANDTSMTVN